MAALSPDQTRAGAAGVAISTPAAQAIPRPGRYEIDIAALGAGKWTMRIQIGSPADTADYAFTVSP